MMLSAEKLNALPCGDQEAGVNRIKSAAELNALPYGTAPFAAGLTAADYAKQHGEHGESFRYFDALPLPDATAASNKDGLVFTEVTLGGNQKGRFRQTTREVFDAEYGLIPKGSTMFSVLPSVVEFRHDARVVRTAQRWRGVTTLRRGLTDTDPLSERFVKAIEQVYVNGVSVSLANVQAVSAATLADNDQGGIKWLSNAPAAGTEYAVTFRYNPLFVCLTESIQGEPIGADGARLPQRILLKKERQ